ncbi:EcsC family protein [Paenibacillus sp. P96]|uniref:EcsC family protein n=1 Tax=Paenibacillus zeirhizosphaerae TaxID=2987519 RepID=A0ABT9FWX6_9BACL|nr:EcsC family protein [Paenibacillus sp. P96]MDP4099011.1 EcsC family protein [Paenibacillus sp. P96]
MGQQSGVPESREYLRDEIRKIEQWEKEQKDVFFWEKIGRIPFMLLDKITPKVIKDKIGTALNELGGFVQSGGQYLVKESTVLKRLQKAAGEEESLTLAQVSTLPVAVMDQTADDLAAGRITLATAQGATTGFGGFFTLAADIPLVLGLSLKVLQEMAICYGFDPKDKRERVFIIKCLQFASSDIVGKKAVLEELARYDAPRDGEDQVAAQIQGWREVLNTYRDNFGWKKLFQLVPVAGMLFGSLINRSAIGDVAEAGKMLYKKRRILQRLAEEEGAAADSN